MALYQVVSGNQILAADLNQFYNLVTGAMSDQQFNLANTFVVDANAQSNGSYSTVAMPQRLGFGGSGTGEAIASKRGTGLGQNGLDFVTDYNLHMRLYNSGGLCVGFSTQQDPGQNNLFVSSGKLAIGNLNYRAITNSLAANRRIECGQSGNVVVAANSSATIAVTFNTAFSGTPDSVVAMIAGSTYLANPFKISVTNDSTNSTSATFFVFNDEASSVTVSLFYIAIGPS